MKVQRPRKTCLGRRRRVALALGAAACAIAQAWATVAAAEPDVLPGSAPLTLEGDIASQLVAGADKFLNDQIDRSTAARDRYWQRDFSSVEAYERSLATNRGRLAHILGVRDARPADNDFELVGSTRRPALIAKAEQYEVFAVRWAAFGSVSGEGLLLLPTGRDPVADVVALPDCSQTPEQLVGLVPGTPAESQFARRLAESGCRVVVPVLINRDDKLSGQHLSNREWLYRAAYEMGRGLIGYEVQKVLACVDCFASQAAPGSGRVGVIGWSEGGLLALDAAALDPRIGAVCVSGYFADRNRLWQEPLDRNVFGRLERFGDAELAGMIAPRTLIVEAADSTECTLAGGKGGPGRIVTPELADVDAEVQRANQWVQRLGPQARIALERSGSGAGPCGSEAALSRFLEACAPGNRLAPSGAAPKAPGALADPAARHARQVAELERHTQELLAESKYVRQEFFWKRLKYDSLDAYRASTKPLGEYFSEQVIGRFDQELLPPRPRTRKIEENDRWTRYEVVLDVFPDVIAYGLLTLPRGLQPGERRPVVVCQHGLEGRPQDVISSAGYEFYKAFATKLAEQGFVTFAPQNPYIFQDRFRTLQRKANPLGKTLFSLIVPQHRQAVRWLQQLPQVDPERVAFYGLSYGGKTAMRVPALVPEYCLSICSADFNEWIDKNASTRGPYSYLFTGEYEIFEFDLGNTFNYAEMAALIAPRPFMVERGHFDGVGTDENVAFEYAKVRRLYAALLHIPERTDIEWFAGPHSINEQGTYAFLRRQLNWPRKP